MNRVDIEGMNEVIRPKWSKTRLLHIVNIHIRIGGIILLSIFVIADESISCVRSITVIHDAPSFRSIDNVMKNPVNVVRPTLVLGM
jgi:hypothetical protein